MILSFVKAGFPETARTAAAGKALSDVKLGNYVKTCWPNPDSNALIVNYNINCTKWKHKFEKNAEICRMQGTVTNRVQRLQKHSVPEAFSYRLSIQQMPVISTHPVPASLLPLFQIRQY